jgi:hypothetical protein
MEEHFLFVFPKSFPAKKVTCVPETREMAVSPILKVSAKNRRCKKCLDYASGSDWEEVKYKKKSL